MGGILRRMKSLCINFALVLIATSAAADPVSDVRCSEIGFSKAAENRDVESFVAFIDDDARFAGSTAMRRGAAEITAAWGVFFEDNGPAIKWRPRFVEVLEDGTLALSRGPYRVIDRDSAGNRTERWGTFNSVWRKHPDGNWRVVFDAGSPAAAPPDAETRALLDATDECS